ncbi:MAG TPA: hypothetical protein VH640_00970 [Bryobacteraceae bacterium]
MPKAKAIDEPAKAQIDRILRSECFQSSESLRRLLKFLGDKAFCGEAHELKEYTIAVDAFGKPPSYDPRHDSSIRIMAGRLREKLEDYYEAEGKDEPVVIDLPKGGFRLHWRDRPSPHDSGPFVERAKVEPAKIERANIEPVNIDPAKIELAKVGRSIRIVLVALVCGLVGVTIWAFHIRTQLREERERAAVRPADLTPELRAMWAPFLRSKQHLLISVNTPLFVLLPAVGWFRDGRVNQAEDVSKSPLIGAVEKTLKAENPATSDYWTPFGQLNAVFMLEKLLGRQLDISLVKSDELSWRQLSQNNVILIGPSSAFDHYLTELPIRGDLSVSENLGVIDRNPKPGGPQIYRDELLYDKSDSGLTYALISHLPSQLGDNEIEYFGCNDIAGCMAAIRWYADPASAHRLWSEMKEPSGKFPLYYQILLKVRFQGGVPIESSYVLHRDF